MAAKIVPAVIDICDRHRLHWKRTLVCKMQYLVWPHVGQTKPWGHRQCIKALRHCSSEPNCFIKSCKLRPCWNWMLFLLMVAPSFFQAWEQVTMPGVLLSAYPLENWLRFIGNQKILWMCEKIIGSKMYNFFWRNISDRLVNSDEGPNCHTKCH